MNRIRWAALGDINAFFGLMLDNVAVLLILLTSLTLGGAFTPRFIVERMIPGTAIGVLIGDVVYTIMGIRLARRLNRSDVTAMPLGLDTPSTFAAAFLVLLPALEQGLKEQAGDRDTAMTFAWHVGAVMLVLIGLLKTLLAPAGNAVRRWIPRAGLLGSLAAIALALIAFMPLLERIAAVPLVGLLSLTVILVTLVARRDLPGRIPGALAAVLLGGVLYIILQSLDMAPPLQDTEMEGTMMPVPAEVWQWSWWEHVLATALGKLPLMLPFALATVVGGIDCTESAAAAGDEYDTRAILLTEGLASVVAGLCGGVIQNTPYIGQPAYKAMGGRSAYTLATAVFIGAAGCLGWFMHLFAVLPPAAIFPILVYVGIEITGQSYHATPPRHYPAVAFATLPALAYLVLIQVSVALGGNAPAGDAALTLQSLRCLGHGFIVTSLLWGALLAELIDGRLMRSAAYLLVAAACSLLGIMHSPLRDERVAWPWQVVKELDGAAPYQTPYHWALAYALAAALVLLLARVPTGAPRHTEKEG